MEWIRETAIFYRPTDVTNGTPLAVFEIDDEISVPHFQALRDIRN